MKSEIKNDGINKNYIYNTVLQVTSLLFPFATTPYISRVLGVENIGRYSFATAMVTYFTLLSALGSNTYGQREVAFCRDDKKLLSQVFWNVFIFRCLTSTISTIFYLVYIALFQEFNSVNLIVMFNIFNVAIEITWFYQGIEKFQKITMRSLLTRLIMLGGIFLFVKNTNDLWKYACVMVSASILGNLVMWLSLPKYIIKVEKAFPLDILKGTWTMFLPSVAISVYTILDKSMIGIMTRSNYANGCYEQSERIVRIAITIVTSIGTVILPRVANLFQKNNIDAAKHYVYLAFRIVWMTSVPIMFGLMSIASIFIPWFLGFEFEESIVLIYVFSILVVVVSLAYVVGLSYLIPTKQQNVYTASVTIAAVANFFTNMLLIPHHGAFGAALSSVFAESIGTSIQLGYCIRKKQLDMKEIFSPCWRYIVSGIFMYIGITILKRIFISGAMSLLILIFVGGIIYVGFLFALGDSFFKFWSQRYYYKFKDFLITFFRK